ncbi:MAG: hypothetical protein ACOH2H_21775 [Cypionkella sp.]
MSLFAILRQLVGPSRAECRSVLIDVAILSLSATLIVTGGGFLIAAGFWQLRQLWGEEAALVVMGLGLFALACLILLIRSATRKPAPPPVDPMAQIVFDLCFSLGQALTRRRKD